MLDAKEIYRDLHGQLHKLDQERLKRYKKVEPFKYLFWSIFIIGGAFLIYVLNQNGKEASTPIAIAFAVGTFLSLIIYIIVYFINLKKFKKQFTGLIAPKIIKSIDLSLEYDYKGKVPQEVIKGSKLFQSFNQYSCQDLVTGKLEGNEIRFAEIKLVRKNHGKDNNSSTTVFSGIFFESELSVTFPTDIWIVPKYQWKSLWGDSRERFKMEHPALKPYRIYVADPVVAEQILQPYILGRIAKVNSDLKDAGIITKPLNYHFGSNKIQMAMSTKYRFMEPSLGKSIDSEAFIKKQTDLLNSLSHLLEDLTLT